VGAGRFGVQLFSSQKSEPTHLQNKQLSATHWTRDNVHLVKHKLVSSSLSYTLVDNIGGLKSHHLR
jgi:hypothetical protein